MSGRVRVSRSVDKFKLRARVKTLSLNFFRLEIENKIFGAKPECQLQFLSRVDFYVSFLEFPNI